MLKQETIERREKTKRVFSANLRYLMQRDGWKNKQFREGICQRREFDGIKAGDVLPGLDKACEIADRLEVSLDWMLTDHNFGDDDKPSQI